MSFQRKRGAPSVPQFWSDPKHHNRLLAQAVNGALTGKTNNVLFVTLEVDATQTVVDDHDLTPDSTCILQPTSASAAAALAGLWTEHRARQMVIHHDSSSATDRTFRAVLFG